MLSENPIRWTSPSTWPWVVYVWLVFLLIGWAKPVWRWFQKQQASNWPNTQGRIESVSVQPKKQFFVSIGARGRAPSFAADLAYSYSVQGQWYPGHYERQFGSEEEAWEFVRDLQGKPVSISYNPQDVAKSALSEDALASLPKMRVPLPEGESFQAPVADVPGWAKPLLVPFVALSAVGLGLSLWVHLGAVAGRKVAPEAFFWMLHVGIFVVWFPAVLVSTKRVGNTARSDFWRVALRGSPEWMRYMAYAFFGYAVVNFLFFMTKAPSGSSGANPPAIVWRGFSGHWMAFYSAALAILYSAVHGQGNGFRCINGHLVSPSTRYCERCGQPVVRVS